MVTDYAKEKGITVLVRGVRDDADLTYEMLMAHNNRHLYGNIETLFLPAEQGSCEISATEVRAKLKNGGDVFSLVPKEILSVLL